MAITTLDLISNFNSFALLQVLTNGERGTTLLPSLHVYREAFREGNWGYAAAMGNVMVIVVGVFLIVYLWGNRKAATHDSDRPQRVTRPLQYLALAGYMIFLVPAVVPADDGLQDHAEIPDRDPSCSRAGPTGRTSAMRSTRRISRRPGTAPRSRSSRCC